MGWHPQADVEEIIGSEGKLAAKGYRASANDHGTLEAAAELARAAREGGRPVVQVRLAFGPNYVDHPAGSPLLGAAAGFGILQAGTPSTEIVAEVNPEADDIVITKARVSPFFGTSLELTLRTLGASSVAIAGVATDLAVQSAARDAHDRDFMVSVVAAACAAADERDHAAALANLAKIAKVRRLWRTIAGTRQVVQSVLTAGRLAAGGESRRRTFAPSG